MKMKNKLLSNEMSSARNGRPAEFGNFRLTWPLSLNRHCEHGSAIQGRYKEKTTLLNRLDPGSMPGMTTTAKSAEDSRQKLSGMTALFTRGGFTLIELLVVVLIIGILAAVAVPQYQTAVMKSRYTELMLLGNAIYKARLVHKMADGSYGNDFTQLDISLPNCSLQTHGDNENATYHCSNKKFYCEIYDNWTHCYMDNESLYYSILSGNGKRQCGAKIQDKIANQVCKSITGATGASNDTHTWYSFQ